MRVLQALLEHSRDAMCQAENPFRRRTAQHWRSVDVRMEHNPCWSVHGVLRHSVEAVLLMLVLCCPCVTLYGIMHASFDAFQIVDRSIAKNMVWHHGDFLCATG